MQHAACSMHAFMMHDTDAIAYTDAIVGLLY